MAWKNWSYWLKGGIIGIILIIVLILVMVFTPLDLKPSLIATNSDAYQTIAVVPLLLIEWFVYGALIGWIYGKIKQRGKKNG